MHALLKKKTHTTNNKHLRIQILNLSKSKNLEQDTQKQVPKP